MAQRVQRHSPKTTPSIPADTGFPWLEILLAVSAVAFLFSLFPGLWWGLLAAIDVRNWTWRSYAIVSAAAIAVLVVLKGRLEQ